MPSCHITQRHKLKWMVHAIFNGKKTYEVTGNPALAGRTAMANEFPHSSSSETTLLIGQYLILNIYLMMSGSVSRCFYMPHSAHPSRRFLKLLTELAETTVLRRLFQTFRTSWLKKTWPVIRMTRLDGQSSWTGDHGGCRHFYCTPVLLIPTHVDGLHTPTSSILLPVS